MKRTLIANRTNYDRPWAADYLRHVIRPDMHAVIVPTRTDEGYASGTPDWESSFGKGSDLRYDMERPLRSYGVRSFRWLDHGRDDPEAMEQAILHADITVLFGSDPFEAMNMIEDNNLRSALLHGQGMLITLSEVSSVVCAQFENESMYDRGVREGLGLLGGAHLCMHYDESEEQMRRMIRQLEDEGGSLLVLSDQSGVYLEDGHIELLGDAFIADEGDLEELYSLL